MGSRLRRKTSRASIPRAKGSCRRAARTRGGPRAAGRSGASCRPSQCAPSRSCPRSSRRGCSGCRGSARRYQSPSLPPSSCWQPPAFSSGRDTCRCYQGRMSRKARRGAAPVALCCSCCTRYSSRQARISSGATMAAGVRPRAGCYSAGSCSGPQSLAPCWRTSCR